MRLLLFCKSISASSGPTWKHSLMFNSIIHIVYGLYCICLNNSIKLVEVVVAVSRSAVQSLIQLHVVLLLIASRLHLVQRSATYEYVCCNETCIKINTLCCFWKNETITHDESSNIKNNGKTLTFATVTVSEDWKFYRNDMSSQYHANYFVRLQIWTMSWK